MWNSLDSVQSLEHVRMCVVYEVYMKYYVLNA